MSAKSDAIEQLREQVKAAKAAAFPQELRDMDIPSLAALAEAHSIGTNCHGWTNPYPASDPRSLLLEYQFKGFHDESRFKCSLQARQTGKDFQHEGEIVTDCLAQQTRWQVAAPSERQSLDSLDQAKLWSQAWDFAIEDYDETREGLGGETLLKSAEITFANGSKVRAVPGKPDTVRGPSTNNYLTEFDFFENPTATWRAILPSIVNPLRGGEKKIRIATTPNGKGSAMHKIWTKGDGKKMRWSRHLVTIYHAVLMGMPVDVEELKEALDDPDGWAQEMECRFLDNASVLLPYELIGACEDSTATETLDRMLLQYRAAQLYLGIDVGRKKDLTVFWIMEALGGVMWTRGVLVFDRVPFREQEKAAREILRSPAVRRCAIDCTGIGAMLAENLAADFGKWRVEECQFTAPFKESIYLRMRAAFDDRTVRVPVSRVIREDLHGLSKVTSASGATRFLAPHNDDGHCDRATALALALHAADAPAFTVSPMRTVDTLLARGGAERLSRQLEG